MHFLLTFYDSFLFLGWTAHSTINHLRQNLLNVNTMPQRADLLSWADGNADKWRKGWGGCLNGPHNEKLVILTNRQADTQQRVTTVTQSLCRKPSSHSQENRKHNNQGETTEKIPCTVKKTSILKSHFIPQRGLKSAWHLLLLCWFYVFEFG